MQFTDVSQLLAQYQQETRLVIGAVLLFVAALFGAGAVYLRGAVNNSLKKQEIGIKALEDTVTTKAEKSDAEVQKEVLYLKMVENNHNDLRDLRSKYETLQTSYTKQVDLVEELENDIAMMRTERDEQSRAFMAKLSELQEEITQLRSERDDLLKKLEEEQAARKQAESARDIAQEAHNIERERLTSDIRSLQDQINELRQNQQKSQEGVT